MSVVPPGYVPWSHPSPLLDAIGGFLQAADDPLRAGFVVETAPTVDIFTNPKNQLTEDYVSGRFG